MHKCNGCGKDEDSVSFGWRTVNGKRYPKHLCNICRREYDKKFKRDKQLRIQHYRNLAEKEKKERAENTNRDRWILHDARQSDKRKGFENDLTREFIRGVISQPCVYCGERELKMTLDRVDNTRPHMRDNVVGCCIRCNLLRRDLPHVAWLELVPAIRSAREKSLFGTWTGQVCRRGEMAEREA